MSPRTRSLLAGATPSHPLTPGKDEFESHADPASSSQRGEISIAALSAPPGFDVELYSPDVPGARSIELGEPGVAFVGTRGKRSSVYAVVDDDRDGTVDRVETIAQAMNSPNGLAYRRGDLYVATIGSLWVLPNIAEQLSSPPEPQLVTDVLPDEAHHGWRVMEFGPDGRLYIGIGAPCDTCQSDEPFATVSRLTIEGRQAGQLETFARGVRNTVGLAFHPSTQELWFTDNGRDALGDHLPPDELNSAPERGLHFGYPACHGGVVADPQLSGLRSCAESTPPVQNLGAHVAALGMAFTHGHGWPRPHDEAVLIAEHGSWNRKDKAGYRVTEVLLEGSEARSYRPLLTGFYDEASDTVRGRPVDVEMLPDGSALVSDDFQGALYRIVPAQAPP